MHSVAILSRDSALYSTQLQNHCLKTFFQYSVIIIFDMSEGQHFITF